MVCGAAHLFVDGRDGLLKELRLFVSLSPFVPVISSKCRADWGFPEMAAKVFLDKGYGGLSSTWNIHLLPF